MISLSLVTVLLNSTSSKWQTATWDDYLAYRDHPSLERVKLFYQEGKQVIAFCLGDHGKYEQIEYSMALSGLPIILLEQTLEQLTELDNGLAAIWFNQQIVNINIKE